MLKYKDSVMVALLPKAPFWSKIDIPHLTLVYAGEIPDLKVSDFNDLAKTTLAMSTKFDTLELKVKKPGVLGKGDELVDVLLLESTPPLESMRRILKFWNASEHKTFKPHVTIGPKGSIGSPLPSVITFDRISVHWGEEQLIYFLKKRGH